ncbi:MAG: ABC transporter ATP-binding protein [Actinobacteria bacterium]|nr:ABC transporter ATP-binding protein [Actinomycetota bacterium]
MSPAVTSAVVEVKGITKAFPGVLANDDISFDVRPGEVHSLLGENGAGKSTLMGILSGIQTPDSGGILVDGEPVRIDSPRKALDIGIGTVYQHSTLIPALTVLQNLMLGDSGKLLLDAASARARLEEFGALLGVDVDPEARAADLALGRQQQVEIIKALWRGSRLLILDEPTSMLTPQAVDELYTVLARLKADGLATIFITHKLHEAVSLGDRISVLRRGRMVGTLDAAAVSSTPPDKLEEIVIEMMFGSAAADLADVGELRVGLGEAEAVEAHARATKAAVGEPLLELAGVAAPGEGTDPGVADIDLVVHEGEVVGVAGVDGNGQRALAEAISGQRRLTAGEIRLFGAPVDRLNVLKREKLGLRYLTDDRIGEGIVGSLSISLNLFLKRIGQAPYWRYGSIRRGTIDARAEELCEQFDVRAPGVETRAGTLSGGNMQKVLLARELSFGAKVVVFHKPTYGLDLKTTLGVREMIRQMRDGKAALVISTDLDELLEVSDRIVVLSRGRLVGEAEPGPGAAERIGGMMIGDVSLSLAGAGAEGTE